MWKLLNRQISLGIQYGYGNKPKLGADPSTYKSLDCSAEARQLLFAGTTGQLIVPDGSFYQHQWCVQEGLHKVDYQDIGKYGYGRVFWAFYNPPTPLVGHTWIIDGTKFRSLESRGHAGPSSRPWNDPTLIRIVTSCYEIPCLP